MNSPLRPIAQGNWNNWNNTFVQGPDFNTNPQPLLSDIDFDNNGDMILGVLDVYGIKTGHDNYRNVTTDFGLYDVIIFGDILRATKSGSTWTNNVGSGGVEYSGHDWFATFVFVGLWIDQSNDVCDRSSWGNYQWSHCVK